MKRLCTALFLALLLTVSAVASTLLFSTTTSSAPIASTTAETAFNQSYSLPGGALAAGDVLRIRASGRISSIGAPGVIVKVRIGGQVIASFTLWTDEAIDRTAHWAIDCEATVRSVGSLGVLCRGAAFGHATPRAPSEGEPGLTCGSELAGTFALNTNAARVVDITAQWNEGKPENSIVMDTFVIEHLQ